MGCDGCQPVWGEDDHDSVHSSHSVVSGVFGVVDTTKGIGVKGSKDSPVLPETKTIVIRDTPTEELLELHELWKEQLGWGLSKQARKSLEIKIGAIEYRLRERKVEF